MAGWSMPPAPASLKKTIESWHSFLAGNSDFAKVDLRTDKPAHFDALDPVIDEAGVLRTSPREHGLEAFYGAVLRRVK